MVPASFTRQEHDNAPEETNGTKVHCNKPSRVNEHQCFLVADVEVKAGTEEDHSDFYQND